MRILCIHRHYGPDTTPSAAILHAMLQRFVAEGHEVTAFAAQACCGELRQPPRPAADIMDGVPVHRIRLLPERNSQRLRQVINTAWFLTRAVLFSRQRHKFDLVLGSSCTPVTMGLTLHLIRRLNGLPYVVHCQQLRPVSASSADMAQAPFVSRLLKRLELKTLQQAEQIIVLSEDMRQTVLRSQIPAERVQIINNFALHTPDDPEILANPFLRACASRSLAEPTSGAATPTRTFRLIFAGNLGTHQALHRIVDAAHLLYDDQDIQFVFLGQGEQRAALQAQAGGLIGRTVHFIPHQPANVAFACMLHSHLGIISLAEGIYRTAFPSKLMTYLAAGIPVLAVVETQSELAELVRAHSLGFVTPDDMPEKIAATIRQARSMRRAGLSPPAELMRVRAEKLFGRAAALEKWSQLLSELETSWQQHQEQRPTRAA